MDTEARSNASRSSAQSSTTTHAGNAVTAGQGPVKEDVASSKSAGGGAHRVRRRNRMISSCLECRRRKLKCDKSHPCTNCTKFSRDCVFLAPALDQASQLKLTEIKEKVGSLERLLERDVVRAASKTHDGASSSHERPPLDDAADFLPTNEEEKDLRPTPFATHDAAYGNEGDDDDLLDLGIRLGKMRLTERIGGFFRPKVSEELQKTINQGDDTQDGRHEEPPKPIVLPPASEWLKPSSSYITPSSGFFFGAASNAASLIDFLPSRLAADRLIKQYFECVHPLCQVLHRPTFEKDYDNFWNDITLGIEPPSSVQTVVFAAMFSGVVSMDDDLVMMEFGVEKPRLLDNFKLGTETALSRANFLRTTRLEVLQAFVMYLIPLCREEISRAHSVLVGAAIRMAECMGVHRDGEYYGMNPLETYIRRLTWYQICFLDLRTCEAQGPRPTIRSEEYDTKFPPNANESGYSTTGRPPASVDSWTDTTLTLLRFEVNEMMRTIWVDRPRIETRQVSVTDVLQRIEEFRSKMAAKYDHLIDERIPLHKAAKLIKNLITSRLHVMVLHRYHHSAAGPMPDRLRNILLISSLTMLETAIPLETLPELKPWAWYGGALQQYHAALLTLTEVYLNGNRSKLADRIWKCLDYVFERDPTQDRHEKARDILAEVQQKTAVYQSMRGMRAPAQVEKLLGPRAPTVATISHRSEKPRYSASSRGGSDAAASKNTKTQEADGWVGKVPLTQAQADHTNHGHPWAMLSQTLKDENDATPTSSDGNKTEQDTSVTTPAVSLYNGVSNAPKLAMDLPQQDDLMADIDWEVFDALFPPDQIEGLNLPGLQHGGTSNSYQ